MCARCDKLKLFNSEDIVVVDDFAGTRWAGAVRSGPILVDVIDDFRVDGIAPSVSSYRGTIALQIDGVGDRLPVFRPLLITTTDTVPGDTGTTATLTVDAPHTFSTIDTIGDQDFYAVTLTAGVAYQIGMYGRSGGASLTPLADSYVEIYNAAGNLVTTGDGGANTPANMVNSGFDVLLAFTPTATGTYYINARAFDNAPADGTNGDMVGDYELFVQTAPPGSYDPYYEPTDPLYAIDWGSRVNRVNQSAANPDGNEGTRATGNAEGDPVRTTLFDVAALAAAQGKAIDGKNVITIYFAKAGDVFTSLEDPASPGLPPATITATGVQQFERDAVFTSLMEFAKVADIVYLEVQDRNHADFVYTSYQGTPGPGVSLLGSMAPPDEANEGLAQFNSGDNRWNALNLQQGGFSFVTLIHEFGHGHGLAHPHDNGGRSGILNGVEAEGAGVADYTTGDFGLNQGVFTMMSYEDGWQSSPHGNAPTNVGYGYLGGLMAFDIAAIQDKYGVNEEWATGDNVYTLKDVNAAGTFYSSIWDGGGTDSIVYNGARDATIDLRAASLRYEVGGGGRVSFASGIFGGFTIANGVTIENASGGSGNDMLFGNATANILDGGDGNDVIDGVGGVDVLNGGAGFDTLRLNAATAGSSFNGGDGTDTLDISGVLTLPTVVTSIEVVNLQPGAELSLTRDQYVGLIGQGATLWGGAGTVIVNLGVEDQIVVPRPAISPGSSLTFTFNGTSGSDVVKGVQDAFNIFNGGDGADSVRGGARSDVLNGGAGNDKIAGAGGADTLSGGSGADKFRYAAASESGVGAAADHITDFAIGSDAITFGSFDADPLTAGIQPVDFEFIGGSGFTATGASEIRYTDAGLNLLVEIDVNGDGFADMHIVLDNLGGQVLTASDFLL